MAFARGGSRPGLPSPAVAFARQYRRIMRFVMFVVDGATETASRGEIAAIDAFNDDLRRDGRFVLAVGIGAPDTAQLFDERTFGSHESQMHRDTPHVAGSLQGTDEFYSGFWVIDNVDHETAQLLAARASRACNRKVELRPLLR